MTETKIQALIQLAIEGNNQAQNNLLDKFWNLVYYYVLSKVQNEEDAEDLSIEIFTKMFNKLHLYNDDFDFKKWLIAIAHNTVIDYYRKKSIKTYSLEDEFLLDIPETNATPEEQLMQSQENQQVIDAIEKLKPKYREILKFRYLKNKKLEEISNELNLSLSNTKVRLLRGKKLLEDILNPNSVL